MATIPLLNAKGKALGEGARIQDFSEEQWHAEPKRCRRRGLWTVVVGGTRKLFPPPGFLPAGVRDDPTRGGPLCEDHAIPALFSYDDAIATAVEPVTEDDAVVGEWWFQYMRHQRRTFEAMVAASPDRKVWDGRRVRVERRSAR